MADSLGDKDDAPATNATAAEASSPNTKTEQELTPPIDAGHTDAVVPARNASNATTKTSPPINNVPTTAATTAEDTYCLKQIHWRSSTINIITQNKNGPCPLIALCKQPALRMINLN